MAGMVKATAILVAAVMLSEAASAAGDMAADRADCAENLVGLSMCLEYVEGSARMPTPDCCQGLEKVRKEKPRCLCVLIKDHDNPELAVKINVTLAISLPAVCHVPANISHCPKLLNLPPGSKDAEIFNQPGALAVQGNGSSSASATSGGSHTTGNTISPANSRGPAAFLMRCEGAWLLKWLGLEMVGGIWVCSVISFLPILVAFC